MSHVIAFLASLGQNPVSSRQFAGAVASLDIDADARDALLARDAAALGAMLGARPKVVYALAPAEDDQPTREPGRDDDEVHGAH